MGLSRKRKRELNRLRSNAEDLWENQKDVLEHASRVVREASRQAAHYAREEVSPRVRETYEDRVRPAVASGLSATRHGVSSAREKLTEEVFPAVSSALGSALAVLEVAKDPRVRDALRKVTATGSRVGSQVGLVKSKPSSGPGRYIMIGVGVVALAGIAYAAWQTLRADDELWIDDEPEGDSASE